MSTPWPVLFLLGTFVAFGYSACPTILTKAQWGGRAPASTPTKMSVPVPYTVVHHGGSKDYCTTQSACAAIVRSYQNYHMNTHGWNDIGYSFVVGEDGNIYAGRGWDAVGAHAPNYNSRSIGICVIGDFTARAPNAKALAAVKALIACGVEKKKIVSAYKLIGHRQSSGSSTVCPGNALYAQIKTWPHWTANPSLLDVLVEKASVVKQ